jgi:hypothetical protein
MGVLLLMFSAATLAQVQQIDLAQQLAAGTGWNPLRVVVTGQRVQVYVGGVKSPTLEVRKLGSLDRGQVGLWVGNGSDGGFSNFRITLAK